MSTLIVGVDRSESSTRAVQLAVRLAVLLDLRLIIAHVIAWSPYSFQTPTENESRHRQRESEITAANEQIVVPMVALAAGLEGSVETVIRHGNPSETLLDLADEVGAAHVVVGRTGDSGLKVSLFGTVASRLAQHATVPVTVVP